MIDVQPLSGFTSGDFSPLPFLEDSVEFLGDGLGLSAQMAASESGGFYALPLALADEMSFGFRHVGEKLQEDVRDESTGQIAVLVGIEERHIQNYNGYLLFLGQQPLLIEYFFVVAAQTVDAFDIEDVALAELFQQRVVSGAIKAFA